VAHFPSRNFPEKNSCHVSWQESRQEICARWDPAKKKLSSSILVRILLGSKILLVFPARTKFSPRKNSCIEIPTEGALNLILRFDPGSKCHSETIVSHI